MLGWLNAEPQIPQLLPQVARVSPLPAAQATAAPDLTATAGRGLRPGPSFCESRRHPHGGCALRHGSCWACRGAVPDRYLAANPDLRGSTPMQVYDACAAALTGAGLIVIPNRHMLFGGWCCAAEDNNGLWHNDDWPAAKFTAA